MVLYSSFLALTISALPVSVGCESRAGSRGGTSGRLSAVGESCAATADCGAEFRCVDQTCQTIARSNLGDFHLAAGQVAMGERSFDKAITALRAAEAEYKRAEADAPADVVCTLGLALARMSADPLKAEEAAAKLHRCVRRTVGGSAIQKNALHALALLTPAGFEPSHLASETPADRYLTAAAQKPAVDSVAITATVDKNNTRKTFTQWLEILAGPEARQAVAPCWLAHWEATKKDELLVKVPYRYSFRLDPDDEYRDRGVLTVSKNAAPKEKAGKCVLAALKPLGDAMAKGGGEYSWTATFMLSIKPKG